MPPIDTRLQDEAVPNTLWDDACLAIKLARAMVASPAMAMPSFDIRAQAGPVLDKWLELLEKALNEIQFTRLQAGTHFDDLHDKLDLSATLASGKQVFCAGILSRCEGGMLVVPVSSVMPPELAAGLTQAVDNRGAEIGSTGFGLIVIDESGDDDAFLPVSLQDRLMFHLDLRDVRYGEVLDTVVGGQSKPVQPALYNAAMAEELCAVSLGFGLTSIRPSRQAMQIAAFHAGFCGRNQVEKEDVLAAIRLSLVNRAVAFPLEAEDETVEETPPPSERETEPEPKSDQSNSPEIPQDMTVESLLAQLPAGLLAMQQRSAKLRRNRQNSGRSEGNSTSFNRGRPVVSVRGNFNTGRRLDLIATLRASAPWQTIRRKHAPNKNRVQIRKNDFHIKRFYKPSETTSIFVVDASGSTAVNRLGEAKGAVEILLGESYSRRDHVALVSMRGNKSELVLPPTRSLARARKTLSGMTGGGGTPLADGIQTARLIADDEFRRGRIPQIVFLTDGSANISLAGEANRTVAMDDALGVAKSLAVLDCRVLVLDVGRGSNGHARKIAETMQANYLPMPFASSKNISDAVRVSET